MAVDTEERVAPNDADLRDNLNAQEQNPDSLGDSSSDEIPYTPGDNGSKTNGSRWQDRLSNTLKGKKKGIIGAILGGIGLISIPFFGSAALPFSILGNMNAKSMLNGFQQYADDYYGFTIFGKSGAVKTSATGDKLKGLRDTEIKELKAKGVEFKPENGTKTKTGKYTFEAVKVPGGSWVDASGFKEALKDSSFRNTIRFTKGSLWKSMKSQAYKTVKGVFKLITNPDIKGETPEESGRKLAESVTERPTGSAGGSFNPGEDENGTRANWSKQGEGIGDSLLDAVEAEARVVYTDEVDAQQLAMDGDAGNVSTQLDPARYTDANDMKGVGSKLWSFVNVVDPLDATCTIYQTAYTANVLARTVALYNIVRLGIAMTATTERAQAGEDTDNSMNNLMNLLQTKDPATQREFTASSYASILFNGTLSGEPSSVSAIGGSLMAMMYSAMHSLHSSVGNLTTAGLPTGTDDARVGRAFLKNVCGVATNLGVQVGATAVSIVAAVVTGGGSGAAVGLAKTALSQGLKKFVADMGKELGKKVGKEAIQAAWKEAKDDVAQQGVLKALAKQSWQAVSKLVKNMSVWDKLGFLLLGVNTFGMSYIVHTLSGGNIVGYLSNGFTLLQSWGTARDEVDYRVALGLGGNVGTYGQKNVYQQTEQQYQLAYVEDMQYQAKETPFDITNPYSATGRFAYALQQSTGSQSTNNLPEALVSLAKLPFTLGSTTASASSTSPTSEEIGSYVGNDYYTENNIAVRVTAVPDIVIEKNYSFSEFLNKLVDSDNPQVTYNGDDSETGEPKFNIVPGSDLAKYADKCKNPNRTELDPEFEDEESDNLYDINTCISGGSKYDNNLYPLYDDAVRYIGQVTPSPTEDTETGGGTTPGGWTKEQLDQSDTSGYACAEGSETVAEKYTEAHDGGKKKTVRLCKLTAVKVKSDAAAKFQFSVDGSPAESPVFSSIISAQYVNMMKAMSESKEVDGAMPHVLQTFRTYDMQKQMRIENGCAGNINNYSACSGSPETSVPGTSNHESGYATDFNRYTSEWSKAESWLDAHAAEFCFGPISSEAWHFQPLTLTTEKPCVVSN